MMMDTLIEMGVQPTTAREFERPLRLAMSRFDITTPARQAAFLAQAVVESARLTRLEENLRYTTPERIRQVFPSRVRTMAEAAPLVRNPQALANWVYAGRLGNGSVATGDGWRFRGRGIFQLTGRQNYERASIGLGVDFVQLPDFVARPDYACLSAAWYWQSAGCSALADAGHFDRITRAINGPGMLHADERLAAYRAGLESVA